MGGFLGGRYSYDACPLAGAGGFGPAVQRIGWDIHTGGVRLWKMSVRLTPGVVRAVLWQGEYDD